MRNLMVAMTLLAFACSPASDQAVDPVWGKQACEHCMMLVSDPQPAAQAVLADGARKFFDDVGCLAEWLERGETPARMWVRAHDGSRWIEVRAAHFSAGHRTPMDYGFLPSSAGSSFEELRATLRARRAARAEVP